MDLRDTSLGFYRAWHISLGVEHGLLLALRDAPLGTDTLAGELGLDASAIRLWCEGAWALGLLTRSRDGRYRLAAAHRETLGEPASPEYLGYHFQYIATKSLTFDAIGELLRGQTPRLDLADTYAIATRYDHVASLSSLPVAMRRRLTKGIDVLDLGAGQGGWTRAAMKEYPASRFTATDIDLAPLHALQGASIVEPGRLRTGTFDLVHLGEVLASASRVEAVLRTAYRALRPGGHLHLIEGLRPDGPPRDWGGRLTLAMGLDFATDGSRFLSPLVLRRSLDATGFARATFRDLGGSLYRIQARKPETSRRS